MSDENLTIWTIKICVSFSDWVIELPSLLGKLRQLQDLPCGMNPHAMIEHYRGLAAARRAGGYSRKYHRPFMCGRCGCTRHRIDLRTGGGGGGGVLVWSCGRCRRESAISVVGEENKFGCSQCPYKAGWSDFLRPRETVCQNLHVWRRHLHFFGIKSGQKHQILPQKDQNKQNLLKRVIKNKPKPLGL